MLPHQIHFVAPLVFLVSRALTLLTHHHLINYPMILGLKPKSLVDSSAVVTCCHDAILAHEATVTDLGHCGEQHVFFFMCPTCFWQMILQHWVCLKMGYTPPQKCNVTGAGQWWLTMEWSLGYSRPHYQTTPQVSSFLVMSQNHTAWEPWS